MGPPEWVASPSINGCLMTLQTDTCHDNIDEFITGVAMSNVELFNNPPSNVTANMTTPSLQAITWDMLESSCRSYPDYMLLHNLILQGLPEESKDWDNKLLPYHRHRHLLTTIGPVILVKRADFW